MAFVEFLGLRWPEEAVGLLTVSVADVLECRDEMVKGGMAPKTINRRIASLSSFYKYLQGVASEFRLPITVPNPAHAQFIPRGSSDPRDETKALSATRARQLMGMPSGDTVLDYRDRAILKFFLYSGARIGTACRLKVKDFHYLRRGHDCARREGRQASQDRPPLRGGRGDRRVCGQGRTRQRALVPGATALEGERAK